jgi:hypothetical protein
VTLQADSMANRQTNSVVNRQIYNQRCKQAEPTAWKTSLLNSE